MVIMPNLVGRTLSSSFSLVSDLILPTIISSSVNCLAKKIHSKQPKCLALGQIIGCYDSQLSWGHLHASGKSGWLTALCSVVEQNLTDEGVSVGAHTMPGFPTISYSATPQV